MFQLILSGLALGCIYSLVALGYHITFMTSRTLNFAQGSAMMLGAVAALILIVDFGWPTPLAMLFAILLLGIFGLLLERLAVRPFVLRGSMAWVMSTLAVGIILENVAHAGVRQVAARATQRPGAGPGDQCCGAGIYPLELLIPVVVLVVARRRAALLRRHHAGPRAARHRLRPRGLARRRYRRQSHGRPVLCPQQHAGGSRRRAHRPADRRQQPAWAFSIGLKAFAVAIVGGLEHPVGILVAALAYGVPENLVGGHFGSSAKEIFGFSLVILVLFVRPTGLFGRTRLRRV